MLKDHNHDLIHSLSEKNDAVWRYDKEYIKNSQGCDDCTDMWQKMKDDDNEHIQMLTGEIKRHMDEDRFD